MTPAEAMEEIKQMYAELDDKIRQIRVRRLELVEERLQILAQRKAKVIEERIQAM